MTGVARGVEVSSMLQHDRGVNHDIGRSLDGRRHAEAAARR
jgi:hypothetical protein